MTFVKFSFCQLLTLLCSTVLQAQVLFQTMTTSEPVELGQSCRVQFIMEQTGVDNEFIAPDFHNLEIINGPSVTYPTADVVAGGKLLRNVSYIVKPIKTGIITIPAAKWVMDGKTYFSNEAYLKVITAEEAQKLQQQKQARQQANPNLYLAKGEDPMVKMKEGLFMRVLVDRKTCYVGQPITATFKLYSSLYSKSDIVKNPGLYGFTVQDLVALKDKEMQREQWNGKLYDVYTVRKIQLYPLHAGSFEIDPMEVRSQVYFSEKPVSSLPSHEISEGVFDSDISSPGEGWTKYEFSMHSEPVKIEVKALPAKGKPNSWAGAVGRFRAEWKLREKDVKANQQLHMELTISGNGNFSQLLQPVIAWPGSVEAFEPRIEEQFMPEKNSLAGYKKFIYPIVITKLGATTIPELQFSYFNVDTNGYNNIILPSLVLNIQEAKDTTIKENVSGIAKPSKAFNPAPLFISGIVLLVLAGVVITWRRESKKEKLQKDLEASQPVPAPPAVEWQSFLIPAREALETQSSVFYSELSKGIWAYISDRHHLSGTLLNKTSLRKTLQASWPLSLIDALVQLLEEIEMATYMAAAPVHDKQWMYEEAQRIIREAEPKQD